jgi:hypothetical protein
VEAEDGYPHDGWIHESTCERCGHVNPIGINLFSLPEHFDEEADA